MKALQTSGRGDGCPWLEPWCEQQDAEGEGDEAGERAAQADEASNETDDRWANDVAGKADQRQ